MISATGMEKTASNDGTNLVGRRRINAMLPRDPKALLNKIVSN